MEEDLLYDPSFFLNRELFIDSHKEIVATEEFKNEGWRDICNDLLETYQMIVELYRQYVECFNPIEKEEYWNNYYEAHLIFNEALQEIKNIKE